MKNFKVLLLAAMTLSIAGGCKEKEAEAEMTLPVDTTAMIDTSSLAVDTMVMTSTPAGMPPAPSGSGYAILVASGNEETYAFTQVELWKKRGYEPFVSTITENNQTQYRVRVGLYSTEEEARKVVDELSDKYSVKCMIEQVSN